MQEMQKNMAALSREINAQIDAYDNLEAWGDKLLGVMTAFSGAVQQLEAAKLVQAAQPCTPNAASLKAAQHHISNLTRRFQRVSSFIIHCRHFV